MKKVILFIMVIASLWLTPSSSLAEDVCAKVKIEILQEMTFERQAFDARMKITNGGSGISISNLRVDVSIEDLNGNDVSDKFFMKIASMDNISSVDGSGTVAPSTSAEIHWLIIPSPGAGGETPEGQLYNVGAILNYDLGGKQEITEVVPDTIVVQPMPLLVLDYFEPHEVYADDPFTDDTEPPIPFSLGVRVKNKGFGPARKLKINSGQPKIVENKFGLLIDFRILGSEVNGGAATNSLLVDFGDILPNTAGTARWSMIATLLGKFIEFEASFTHADELGGELTSLLEATNAHFLIHDVLVDIPNRDSIKDFLAEEGVGVKVYESDNVDTIVTDMSSLASLSGVPSTSNPDISLNMPANSGFVYAKVPEPTEGNITVGSVLRSDGKQIRPENFWVNKLKIGKIWKTYLHVFDYNSTGIYTVSYLTEGINDTTPPVTSIVIEEPRAGNPPVHIASETELLFLATDDLSGVKGMKMHVDGLEEDPYFDAINPFKFSQRPALGKGLHTIFYYSEDNAGNIELPKSLTVFLDKDSPLVNVDAHPAKITPDAPPEVSADSDALISVNVTDDTAPLSVIIAILDSSSQIIRNFSINTVSGKTSSIRWDGRDNQGSLLPQGIYNVRVSTTDGLGHSSENEGLTIEISRYLDDRILSSQSGADQINPAIYFDSTVWQDNRNGNWDIYLKTGNQAEVQITSNTFEQINPSISSSHIVWQDNRNGNWDIFYYRRDTQQEAGLALTGDQENPKADGSWIVYQDSRNGNWDIYAYNLTTLENRRITNHERDQVNPSISGNILVWEDYRFGSSEIYSYNLSDNIETRLTVNETYDQKMPVISGNYIVWTDYRNGSSDIYSYNLTTGAERRLTYGNNGQEQAYVQGNKFAYVDSNSDANPDISWGSIIGGVSDRVIDNTYRQEHPVLSGNRLVWQDNRSGNWQIHYAEVTRPDLTIDMYQGFNIVALPREILEQFPTAYTLLTDLNQKEQKGVKLMQYDYTNKVYNSVEMVNNVIVGADFSLADNNAIIIYNEAGGKLTTDITYEPVSMAFFEGMNTIGVSKLANGFNAYDLLSSIKKENIISVQRFDPETGRFQTADMDGDTGKIYGANYVIKPGEGFFVYMKSAVSEWRP